MASILTSRMKRGGMDFLRGVGVWAWLDLAVAELVELGMKKVAVYRQAEKIN
jgi:hypothetical protein